MTEIMSKNIYLLINMKIWKQDGDTDLTAR